MKTWLSVFIEVKNRVITNKNKFHQYNMITKDLYNTMNYWFNEGDYERSSKCAKKLEKYNTMLAEIQNEGKIINHLIDTLPRNYRNMIYKYYC